MPLLDYIFSLHKTSCQNVIACRGWDIVVRTRLSGGLSLLPKSLFVYTTTRSRPANDSSNNGFRDVNGTL
jgi:hypothetical protein